MSITIGTQLGSYEITALLGKGGMGEVYRARDSKLKREVAIKILPDEFDRDQDRVGRFQREAEVLASLNHPNIAGIHDIQEANGSRFLTLELVEGETLAERLSRGPLPLAEALDICRQIAEAVSAAHEKGIIHRDLKPANVKITPEGRVKVLDFGLAKVFEPTAAAVNISNSPTLSALGTIGGVIMGTASYMSPEQARGKPLDRRTDVWSWACVLYESLTGKQAFPSGETVSDTLAGILARDVDWAALPASTPSKIRALLERCLRKDPRRRLHDLADAQIEIEEASSEPTSRVAVPSRRWEYVMAALVVLLLVTSIGLALPYFFTRTPDVATVRFNVFPPEGTSFSPLTIPGASAAPFPKLSPDGRKLAFVASQTKQLIWLQPLDSLTAQPLQGTDEAILPFWSPDGAFIGFFAQDKLKKIAVAGGPPQTLCTVPSQGRGGTWNAAGVILFSWEGQPIFRISAAGGEPIPVTELDRARKETSHQWPYFLPDGRHFLYFVLSSDSKNSGIYVASLDSKDRRLLVGTISDAKYSPTGHLIFIRDGTLMAQRFDPERLELSGEAFPIAERVNYNTVNGVGAFSISDTGGLVYRVGTGQGGQVLAWFDRSGKQFAMAGPPSGEYVNPELSPDGKYVSFQAGTPLDIWWRDLLRASTTRFTFRTQNGHAVWSPDGRVIVFRDGAGNIYRRTFGVVGEDELLYKPDSPAYPADWSRDGRYLVYVSTGLGARNDLWALPMAGDRKPIRLTETPFGEVQGKVSPNSRWIAYASDESRRYEVYIQSFPQPGVKSPVSTAGGVSPRWSRDGKELFYIAPDATLMAVPVRSNGASIEVGSPKPLFQTRIFSGGGITGARRQQYDVAADGRFLINITGAESSAPLVVVLNWQAQLKK